MEAELPPFDKFDAEENMKEAAPVVKKENKSLAVNEKGGLALTSLEDQLRFAERLMKDGMISDSFKTPQQVVIAFQYAKALNVPEILMVKNMYVVNNRPALFAEGPLSLVQRAPSFWKMNEYFIDENGDKIDKPKKGLVLFGSVTEAWRRGDDASQKDWFTLDDLAQAKLNTSKYGPKEIWTKWERIMMRYKARSIALRSKFADSLAGIPISEYDFNFSPEFPDIHVTGKSEQLTNKFRAKAQGEVFEPRENN